MAKNWCLIFSLVVGSSLALTETKAETKTVVGTVTLNGKPVPVTIEVDPEHPDQGQTIKIGDNEVKVSSLSASAHDGAMVLTDRGTTVFNDKETDFKTKTIIK